MSLLSYSILSLITGLFDIQDRYIFQHRDTNSKKISPVLKRNQREVDSLHKRPDFVRCEDSLDVHVSLPQQQLYFLEFFSSQCSRESVKEKYNKRAIYCLVYNQFLDKLYLGRWRYKALQCQKPCPLNWPNNSSHYGHP